MWRSLVLLVVVTFAAAEDQGPTSGFRAYAEPRLAASGVRISRLEKLVEKLRNQIDEAGKVDPSGFLHEIHARLDDVENTKKPFCASKQDIRCGWESAECVSSLLLCDGVDDCHNGWDERGSTCSAGAIKAGAIFSGTANWVSCRNRKDHPVQIQITGVVKAKFFGARIGVRALVGIDFAEDDHEHRSYEAKGYYVFGKKRLVLVPLDSSSSEHLGIVCYFNYGDDVRAECKLAHEATLTKCADIHITLQQS